MFESCRVPSLLRNPDGQQNVDRLVILAISYLRSSYFVFRYLSIGDSSWAGLVIPFTSFLLTFATEFLVHARAATYL
jgi:hypothetical protein